MPRRRQNPSHFEIAIEIEPYLIKYASAGNDGNFLWVNADKEQIWSFVSGQLKIAPPSWKPKKISKKRQLLLRIPLWYIQTKKSGRWISDESKRCLAQMIEVTFWLELFMEVLHSNLVNGEKELVTIRKIRDNYGITEDDFKEESMYKRYRRTKEKRLRRTKTLA